VFLNLRDKASAHRVHGILSKEGTSSLFANDKSRLRLYRPEKLFAIENATRRWIRREISNFDYIMILNEAAGRTYHDITQFPVFPWIVSDFSSKSLDLKDPRSFRNLAKPVGALNSERLKQILERYHVCVLCVFFCASFVNHTHSSTHSPTHIHTQTGTAHITPQWEQLRTIYYDSNLTLHMHCPCKEEDLM